MKEHNLFFLLLPVFIIAFMVFPATIQAQQDVYTSPPLFSQPGNKVNLILDDKIVSTAVSPFINQSGYTMIAAGELAGLLALQLDWADNNQVQLSNGQVSISFRNGQYGYLKNEQVIPLAAAPFINESDLFIPLRPAAEEFGLTIRYDAETKTVLLYSVSSSAENFKTVDIVFPQGLGLWGSITPDSELAARWGDYTIAGGYFTHLNNSPPNRTNNIVLACSQINGTLVKPGDIFSFNAVVGPRNLNNGYLPASIFVGSKVVTGTGGGICQVSSTVYNSALTAGLEIVERHPHTMPVNYVASGYDATVLWEGADFKFKNNKENDLKVLTAVFGDYVVALLVDVK